MTIYLSEDPEVVSAQEEAVRAAGCAEWLAGCKEFLSEVYIVHHNELLDRMYENLRRAAALRMYEEWGGG